MSKKVGWFEGIRNEKMRAKYKKYIAENGKENDFRIVRELAKQWCFDNTKEVREIVRA